MEIKEKIEDLTALVSVESALNDLIKVVCDKSEVTILVYKDTEGYPYIHIHVKDNVIGE